MPKLQPPPRIRSRRDPAHSAGGAGGRGPRPWVVALLIALVIGLVAVFWLLPRLVDPGGAATASIEPPAPTATPAPPTPIPQAPPAGEAPPADGLSRTISASLAEGRSALAAGDPDTARVAFQRVLALDPDNTAAAEGLRRVETLTEIAIHEARALTREHTGDLEGAVAAARRALALDPGSDTARNVVRRVEAKLEERSYEELVTRGLRALEQNRYQTALVVFETAAERRPGAPEVVDGLARSRDGIRRQRIEGHLGKATEAEAAERWPAAVEAYRAVLAIAPNNATAGEGLARSEARLKLAERMRYHLAHPDRLATPEVLDEVIVLRDEAAGTRPDGPEHRALVADLSALIVRASTPVRVTLESDGRTEVVVHRVGRLGVFERRTLELRPGTYTVVGRRAGYRDVRVTLRIEPGRGDEPVSIRCSERI